MVVIFGLEQPMRTEGRESNKTIGEVQMVVLSVTQEGHTTSIPQSKQQNIIYAEVNVSNKIWCDREVSSM